MKRTLRILAALAGLGLLAAVAVVGLGLYDVSARKGHYPGISWVLHTTFQNSVRLRAMPMSEVPDTLDDPAMVALGARHYDSACAPCHSVPGEARTATMLAMTPQPPHIEEAVEPWQANHLHWIVYNGVKMSGMPAWPAEGREDEVWPVVAYLLAVQDGLANEEQVALTLPGQEGVVPALGYCTGCHGGIDSFVPRLDIQTADYLAAELRAYRDGERPSGIMQQAATVVAPETLEALAVHIGRQSPGGPVAWIADDRPGTAEGIGSRGEALARRGTGDVPTCVSCHGPGATEARADFPALAGQDRAYLALQMLLWRDGIRSDSELMLKAARDLTDEDIADLADWYASLPPGKGPQAR